MQIHNDEIALITCSYGPDFQRCQRLCRSVDRWVSGEIAHRLIVPARDLALFRPLENARRSVMAVEDVVPAPFWQVPGTRRWWLDRNGWPLRGWVMQQVTKLSANFASCAEHLIFADSDIQFIRPFNRDAVLDGHRLRLHRIPGAKSDGQHLRWHHKAADLLGTERRYFGADYIGQLISWRRSHLQGLQAHLEYTHSRPWFTGVARALQVSEYILYGAYIDAVVGLEESGHFASAEDLCHCCWFMDEAQALASGNTAPAKNALAVLLQSNLGLSENEEQQILHRVAPRQLHLMEVNS